MLQDVPAGSLAAVVTWLEMTARPLDLLPATRTGFDCQRVERIDPDRYLRLFRAIGTPWLWWGRLRLSPQELVAAIHDQGMDVCVLTVNGEDKGLFELDRRSGTDFEIVYFGVTPDMIGSGAGKYLLTHGLHHAWAARPQRLWLHTCTLDHPGALAFYRKAGFRPYKRALEVREDPRLAGFLPLDAAASVPLL